MVDRLSLPLATRRKYIPIGLTPAVMSKEGLYAGNAGAVSCARAIVASSNKKLLVETLESLELETMQKLLAQ